VRHARSFAPWKDLLGRVELGAEELPLLDQLLEVPAVLSRPRETEGAAVDFADHDLQEQYE